MTRRRTGRFRPADVAVLAPNEDHRWVLERLARWCYGHRRRVLVLWLVALIGFSVIGSAAGGKWEASFRLPATESKRAFDLLEKRFPAQAGDTGKIVFKADRGVRDPAVQQRIEQLLAKVRTAPHV